MYLGEALPAFVMNLKWLSLGKRCSRNWFFFFLLSVTYILCKKGPLGQKTHFKGITVKGKHALGQLLFYSLLLDMFFISSKDLAIKKWENAMQRTCWKHIAYQNFKKFQKFEKKLILSHPAFFLSVTRDIQFSTYVKQHEVIKSSINIWVNCFEYCL